ncbi:MULTISPECIES: hypothetical protein [Actinomadura]|jgi:hypothetical protein|uniref:Uncharacterized protein n=1 Tax=Actinomadura montaniterrae TaxID=1803903 RepID=A0A6L3VBV2_9ACTN|nr:hypothetical protein [Actinomadura montaniterrae]KAB2353562.1 hypothetical protein F9B16_49585 [Actinomadura montaniterrae]
MWQFVLWGLMGAVANRTLAFLEANRRVARPPWRYPRGPGGGYYLFACALHCMLAAMVTSAAAASDMITAPWAAFALGAGAPAVLAKLGRYALLAFPPGHVDGDDDHEDEDDDGPDRAGLTGGRNAES